MTELQLFDPGPASYGLTDRQQRAYDGIKAAGVDGLTSDEIGALLHQPKHGLTDRCEFCGSAGAEVARALRNRGLIRQRRHSTPGGGFYMVWTDTDATEARPGPGELPRGF